MSITPLEIRQKTFEKKLRGYDKDEVDAFLNSLSIEWERMLEQKKSVTNQLSKVEKEVARLKEVENALFNTLKTAEKTGADVIDQARQAAKLHMKETQINADSLLNESIIKSKEIIEKSEKESRSIIQELHEEVKIIQQNYRDIQYHRDQALQELKNLSVTLLEKVERNAEETRSFNLDSYVQRVKKLVRESEERLKIEKKDHTSESDDESNASKRKYNEESSHPSDALMQIQRLNGRSEKNTEEEAENFEENIISTENGGEKVIASNTTKVQDSPSSNDNSEEEPPKEESNNEKIDAQHSNEDKGKLVSFFDNLDNQN